MSRFRTAIAAATFSLLVLAPAIPAAAAPAAQATGTRLAAALLPPSWFGPGLSVMPNSAFNSGGKLEHGPARYNLATVSCANFFFGTTGFGENAAAGNIVGNDVIEYLQAVYQFASPARAAAFFHGSYRAFGRCRSAAFTIGNESVRTKTQSITPGHAGSHQAFVVDLSVTSSYSGVSGHIVTTSHVLYVLAGTDVYDVAPAIFNSVPPVSSKALPMVSALIARVQRIS
jgi:hypothetical protein